MTKHVAFALCCAFAALTASARTYQWPSELKYDFLPKCKVELVDGVVRNADARALPDIGARYSSFVIVDEHSFSLPFEFCEIDACYRADLNGDGEPDYLFVHVEGWNGRFAGESRVAAYVSTRQKEYRVNTFGILHLEAVLEDGVPTLIQYEFRRDRELYRTVLKFDADGFMRPRPTEIIRED